MSLKRDNQCKQAFVALAAMASMPAGADNTEVSASVDTKNFCAAMFVLNKSRAVNEDDALTYTFEDSSDNVNFSEVPVDACLPYRKNPERTLVIDKSPYTQTVGVFSTKRYVRLVISGTPDTDAMVVTPDVILESEFSEFTGYDPASIPGDGQP